MKLQEIDVVAAAKEREGWHVSAYEQSPAVLDEKKWLVACEVQRGNADFIANAPRAIVALAAEVERLREATRWRNCKEEPPPEKGKFLVLYWLHIHFQNFSMTKPPYVGVGWRSDPKDWGKLIYTVHTTGGFVTHLAADQVTHWRPYPKPPTVMMPKEEDV